MVTTQIYRTIRAMSAKMATFCHKNCYFIGVKRGLIKQALRCLHTAKKTAFMS